MAQQYQYAFTVQAHTKDVRHILAPQAGVPLLLSGSRDGSACMLGPSANSSSSGAGFGNSAAQAIGEEWDTKLRVEGPEKRFVSCVGMVRAHGEAYLLLGSSNGVLTTFILPSATSPPPTSGAPEPYHTLIEHKQNLCCMDTSKGGLIASGSWDKTVKIWKDFKVALTIEAHEQAVWAVKFVGEDRVLTASADNKIKLHSVDLSNGKSTVMQEYTGHTQPVRGLSLKPDGKGFWSCANDGLVNVYSFDSPAPQQSLSGHTSFVYSVTALSDGSGAITSGEDGTLRVWSNTDIVQTIAHPATSIWSCTVVPSGKGNGTYIASSANDGQIRFFTKDPALAAQGAVKEGWDQEVRSRELDKSQVGDVKHSDLPGMEALGREGKKDGQVIMVKNNDKVEAYQWSQGESTWQQVGQVVDAVGSGRRQLHEGQEYDYVFDVDVAEGMPALKLPYNVAENPWIAAQRFLEKHDLPSSYSEQVVEFIHKNTGGVQLGQGDANSYVDPFTGGSRYTGGGVSMGGAGGGGGGGGSQSTGYRDPFTGEGAYSSTPALKQTILPVKTILNFKQMNIPAAKQKIATINSQFNFLTSDEMTELDKVYKYLQLPASQLPSSETMVRAEQEDWDVGVVLGAVGKFGYGERFPVLDIIRCVCALSPHFSTAPSLLTILLSSADWGRKINGDKAADTNTLLAIRALANLFTTAQGREVLTPAAKGLLEELEGKGDWEGKGKWKGPVATIGLNYSVLAVQGQLHPSVGPALLSFLIKILDNEKDDNEAIYRAGIAIGNLLVANGFAGNLQVGQVQSAKSLFKARATKLGEKRLVDLAAELDGIGA